MYYFDLRSLFVDWDEFCSTGGDCGVTDTLCYPTERDGTSRRNQRNSEVKRLFWKNLHLLKHQSYFFPEMILLTKLDEDPLILLK
ncbi:hypothetical protein I3760_05G101300 [Carya illinoinensis]|uniref:Uncharacterized protein n=1 Tax=Carya illinoinensis TaxID=32201 RepID=A0A8T1QH36_CARIL|nr:hypothetical protein I3760_05G101300 [Carya illinoinensis]KAG6653767.1 hypothetical protein CIPAW_05G099300 [Carya illinoinensis]